jgi:hypothetical protein
MNQPGRYAPPPADKLGYFINHTNIFIFLKLAYGNLEKGFGRNFFQYSKIAYTRSGARANWQVRNLSRDPDYIANWKFEQKALKYNHISQKIHCQSLSSYETGATLIGSRRSPG